MTKTQCLREAEIPPTEKVLREALGKTYEVWLGLEKQLTGSELALTTDWRYYRDSKAWLCKVCHKKKTVFWLSVWTGFFKISFFFLERHLAGIAALEINENSFVIEKEWGKMIPLIFEIDNQRQLNDLLKVIEFKKKL